MRCDGVLLRQAGEQRGRHGHLLEHVRLAVSEAHAADAANPLVHAQAQPHALGLADGGFRDVQEFDFPRDVGTILAANVAVAHGQFFGGLVVDERTPALAAREQALGFQKVQGLAHGAGAHAELAGEIALIGNGRAGFPFPAGDAFPQCVTHLEIQRPRRKTAGHYPTVQHDTLYRICNALPTS